MMFITLFWSWHLAIALCTVGVLYFIVYKLLKRSGSLDTRFVSGYQSLLPKNSHNHRGGGGNNEIDNHSLMNDLDDDEL